MKFSAGGHLFVAIDNKNIYFFDSYTLVKIH